VVSDFWVAHGEIDLLTVLLFVEIDFGCTNQIVVVFPCVVFQIMGDREQIEELWVNSSKVICCFLGRASRRD
jgi:hypothetical protein